MPVRTKRWSAPASPADGLRVLVARYRPRGVPRGEEPWELWLPDAGPSRELHAAFFGKKGAPVGWDEYKRRYLEEMKGRPEVLARLSALSKAGLITLLCYCEDSSRCHRTLLQGLLR